MSMTIQQAIARIEDHMRVHRIGEPPHIHIGEALQMAIAALREKAEREYPKPLTVEVLKLMEGEPVYVVPVKPSIEDLPGWCVLFDGYACVPGAEWAWDFYEYGKTWIAYRHKPKEA